MDLEEFREMALERLRAMMPEGEAETIEEVAAAYRSVMNSGSKGVDVKNYGFDEKGLSTVMDILRRELGAFAVDRGAVEPRALQRLFMLVGIMLGIEIQRARQIKLDEEARRQEFS